MVIIMIVKDIVDIIETAAPRGLAYDWDNSGFLIGDLNTDVSRVYLTLDVTKETVDEAAAAGAELVIAHHPMFFNPVKSLNVLDKDGYIVQRFMSSGISLYAAHTTMDTANGGINDVLAAKLGIIDTEIIEKNEKYPGCGLGRIGNLDKQIPLKEFAEIVKRELNTPFVRVCGDLNKIIRRAAVGSGACDDLIPTALKMGADVMVTSDMKYHGAIDSVESGICVIDAGHYPTEVFVIDIFERLLIDTGIEIAKSREKDIFQFV